MASARRCGTAFLAQKTANIAPRRQAQRRYANVINLVAYENDDKIAALKMAFVHIPLGVKMSR